MKKMIRATLIAASVCAAGASGAALAVPDSFETAANTSFTQTYSLTPNGADSFAIGVSGFANSYSALSFEILSGSTVVVQVDGTSTNGQLAAAFNDYRNTSVSLSANPYTLVIFGKAGTGAGGVSINLVNGTIVPVPEPETYGMMLAGLGMLVAIVRRRSNRDRSL